MKCVNVLTFLQGQNIRVSALHLRARRGPPVSCGGPDLREPEGPRLKVPVLSELWHPAPRPAIRAKCVWAAEAQGRAPGPTRT